MLSKKERKEVERLVADIAGATALLRTAIGWSESVAASRDYNNATTRLTRYLDQITES